MLSDKKITVIGVGNMGEILLKGLLSSGKIDKSRVTASEVNPERREAIKEQYGIDIHPSCCTAAADADVVLLAVKPQNIAGVLDLLRETLTEDHLLVSIAAGVHVDTIAAHFPDKAMRIIRVMPNAPALVGAGASALFAGRFADDEDLLTARQILDLIGLTVVVDHEEFIDVVTGLSGSGPAYIFMIIEALSDAGVQQGLSRKVANALAAQTVFGAGKMFLETKLHAGALKDLVATPGGTTFAGLRALENGNFRAVIMDAVEAATNKSRELGAKANSPNRS